MTLVPLPKGWSLALSFAVNAYLLGVMVMFARVTYPAFALVDKAAFPAAYAAFNGAIGAPVVLFEFAAFLLPLALYAARPASTPSWAVHALVALGVAYFVITFGWHLPSHRALAAGYNGAAALAPLLASQWARTVVQLTRVALLTWMSAVSAVGLRPRP